VLDFDVRHCKSKTARAAGGIGPLLLVAALSCASDALAQQATAPTAEPAKADDQGIELRRPQGKPLKYELPPIDPNQVPPPEAVVRRESLPVPDRWRIMEGLGLRYGRWDPYNSNVLKGDKPFAPFAKWGPDWFLVLGAVSDSLVELRNLPTPVGDQSSGSAGANDIFGQGRQSTINQDLVFSAAVIKGDTTFRPPDYEFRMVVALNGNRSEAQDVRALDVDPRRGFVRRDYQLGLQQLFADKHLRNVSDRYDFDSLRVGIQPFISDFRGFILQDNALGARLFGTRDNNRWQYNLAVLQRIEKDTNSGLNDIGQPLRRDYTFMANVFRQDFPVPGNTTELTFLRNVNREGGEIYYNNNGFIERPAAVGDARGHDYDVDYLGLSTDGHFGRWNLTSSLYAAFGHDQYQPLAQQPNRIRAYFGAAELSRDFNWLRVRATAVAASGDKDPFDDKATGFDAILENPQIAGSDTSYWIRQAVPLIGGGGVVLSGRNGLLPSLRSSKDQGQSNFVNPGLTLFGLGADADLTPQTRVIANVSKLHFVDTSSLEFLRNQGSISRDIGLDVSAGVNYRPFMTQNIVLNASVAALLPGKGFKQLYDVDLGGPQYSVLFNVLFTF
jgi:hypothetical protein